MFLLIIKTLKNYHMKNFKTNTKLTLLTKKEVKMVLGGRVSAEGSRDHRVSAGGTRDHKN